MLRSCFHQREGESEVRIDRTKPRRFPPQLDEYRKRRKIPHVMPMMTMFSMIRTPTDGSEGSRVHHRAKDAR